MGSNPTRVDQFSMEKRDVHVSCIALLHKTRMKNHFNKMKKEVGMLLQKTTDTRAVGIYKLYEENTH